MTETPDVISICSVRAFYAPEAKLLACRMTGGLSFFAEPSGNADWMNIVTPSVKLHQSVRDTIVEAFRKRGWDPITYGDPKI